MDTAIFHNTTNNSTTNFAGFPRVDARRNSTNNGTSPLYSMTCQNCIYVERDFTKDPIYLHKVKPLAITTAAILPLAYLVGLIFALKVRFEIVHEILIISIIFFRHTTSTICDHQKSMMKTQKKEKTEPMEDMEQLNGQDGCVSSFYLLPQLHLRLLQNV